MHEAPGLYYRFCVIFTFPVLFGSFISYTKSVYHNASFASLFAASTLFYSSPTSKLSDTFDRRLQTRNLNAYIPSHSYKFDVYVDCFRAHVYEMAIWRKGDAGTTFTENKNDATGYTHKPFNID